MGGGSMRGRSMGGGAGVGAWGVGAWGVGARGVGAWEWEHGVGLGWEHGGWSMEVGLGWMEHGGWGWDGSIGVGAEVGAWLFVCLFVCNTNLTPGAYLYTSVQIHGRGKSIMQIWHKIRSKNMKQSLFRTLLKKMHGFNASALTSPPTRFEPLSNAAGLDGQTMLCAPKLIHRPYTQTFPPTRKTNATSENRTCGTSA